MDTKTLISAKDFNSIPYLHTQKPFPAAATVAALGNLFFRHHVHDRFGIHLLHRHYEIPEDHIVLKSQVDDEISLTKIEPVKALDTDKLRGVLYRLADNGFQAYEFEYGAEPEIPPDFLKELTEFLLSNKLEDLIALDVSKQSHDPTLKEYEYEYEYDYGNAATVTVKSTREPVFPKDRKTGMTFALVEGGTIQPYDGPDIYAEKKNTHQVFYNHNAPIVDDLTYTLDRAAIRGVLVSNGILAN